MLTKLTTVVAFFAATLFLISCDVKTPEGTDTIVVEEGAMLEKAQDEAYQGVMKVHDEVMPKMGELNRLKREVEEKLADNSLSASTKQAGQQIVSQLENAGEGMMGWMSNLKKPADMRADMDNDAIMSYLSAQQGEISKVSTDITVVIREAKNFLSSLTEVTGS